MINETTKVTIFFHGDPSVGIFSYSYEMTIPRFLIEDSEGREFYRDKIESFYYDLDGDFHPTVLFDDEEF